MNKINFHIFLIENSNYGSPIEVYDYPMIPNVNDVIMMSNGQMFLVKERILGVKETDNVVLKGIVVINNIDE